MFDFLHLPYIRQLTSEDTELAPEPRAREAGAREEAVVGEGGHHHEEGAQHVSYCQVLDQHYGHPVTLHRAGAECYHSRIITSVMGNMIKPYRYSREAVRTKKFPMRPRRTARAR